MDVDGSFFRLKIEEKRYEVEEAGEKQEYFEKGFLNEKAETKLLKKESTK